MKLELYRASEGHLIGLIANLVGDLSLHSKIQIFENCEGIAEKKDIELDYSDYDYILQLDYGKEYSNTMYNGRVETIRCKYLTDTNYENLWLLLSQSVVNEYISIQVSPNENQS